MFWTCGESAGTLANTTSCRLKLRLKDHEERRKDGVKEWTGLSLIRNVEGARAFLSCRPQDIG